MELNVKAYRLMFTLENVLRELCIEQLNASFGAKWYKSQLSPTALKKFSDGITNDRAQFSISFTSFHPVFYLDFSDLREIIMRKDNWNAAFSNLFGNKSQSLIIASLSQVEPIRNKVAHNRTVQEHEVATLNKLLGDIKNCLGEKDFQSYVSRAHDHPQILRHFVEIGEEVLAIAVDIRAYKNCHAPVIWQSCSKKWWWDELHLGTELSKVDKFYTLAEEYCKLERGRGCGPAIKAWVDAKPVDALASAAGCASRELITLGEREKS